MKYFINAQVNFQFKSAKYTAGARCAKSCTLFYLENSYSMSRKACPPASMLQRRAPDLCGEAEPSNQQGVWALP